MLRNVLYGCSLRPSLVKKLSGPVWSRGRPRGPTIGFGMLTKSRGRARGTVVRDVGERTDAGDLQVQTAKRETGKDW